MFFFQSFLDDSWETLCSVTEKSIPREDAYFTRLGSVRNSIDPFLFIVEMRFILEIEIEKLQRIIV